MRIKKIKEKFSLFLIFVVFSVPFFQLTSYAEKNFELPYACKSYVLMDETSGEILVENNSDEKLPIASLTKIMTMLILAEKVEKENLSLDDEIITTSEHAKSMEGSKIFLEVGEKMSLRDMLKAVALPSANDAAVAIAEYIAGTEEDFVALMNKKATQIGMTNTHFVNACGLHDDEHYASAKDVAIMARELLLNHSWIKKFTSVYSTKIRKDATDIYNTNKLVRFYKGCTGLKTGSTTEAGYCLAASATRGSDETNDKMNLISVCLGIPYELGGVEGGKEREENCKYLLEYGFSSFRVLDEAINEEELKPIEVSRGEKQFVSIGLSDKGTPKLIRKGISSKIEKFIELDKNVDAPVEVGQIVGHVDYKIEGETILRKNIIAKESVDKVNFGFLFLSIIRNFFTGETI